jgi:O-6-methylguanine DNA methyltransferase
MKLIPTGLILYVLIKYQGIRDVSGLIEISAIKRNGTWFSTAVNEKGKLVACAFSDRSRREVERAMQNSVSTMLGRANRTRGNEENFHVLTDFYGGKGSKMASSRLVDLSSVSGFRRDVYRVLCEIPIGKVTTYGAIAQKLGGKHYARAVGTAVATNPLPLIVPCHRVVPASLKVGNYGMCGRDPATGGYMKRMLLEREGVKFEGEKVASQSIWIPS